MAFEEDSGFEFSAKRRERGRFKDCTTDTVYIATKGKDFDCVTKNFRSAVLQDLNHLLPVVQFAAMCFLARMI